MKNDDGTEDRAEAEVRGLVRTREKARRGGKVDEERGKVNAIGCA